VLPCKAGRTAPTLEAGPDLTKADLNPPDVAKLRFRVARKARTGAARLGDRHPWWALGATLRNRPSSGATRTLPPMVGPSLIQHDRKPRTKQVICARSPALTVALPAIKSDPVTVGRSRARYRERRLAGLPSCLALAQTAALVMNITCATRAAG
jgi:hypothetical protein